MAKLKVLWSVNVMIREAAELLGASYESAVTWLDNLCGSLRKYVDLTVVFPSSAVSQLTTLKGDEISFIVIPCSNSYGYEYDEGLTNYYLRVLKKVSPNVIHQWGTEFPNAYNLIRASAELGLTERIIVSIQGIIGVWGREEHFYAGLPSSIINKHSFKDMIRHNCLSEYREKYLKRSEYENLVLNTVSHVIGRTGFDRRETAAINPKLIYHHNNETLRPTFYSGKWTREKSISHRVFISQGGMPYKGFHLALEGLGKLKNDYPDLTIAVTGRSLSDHLSVREKLRLSAYEQYLIKLIDTNGLSGCIEFLGRLDADAMKEQYLKANLFLLPSSIENSPNSLGEAMILGVPVVSADVGGVSELMKPEEEGLIYCWNDVSMMVEQIRRVFNEESEVTDKRIAAAKSHAMITHNPKTNLDELMNIYVELSKK